MENSSTQDPVGKKTLEVIAEADRFNEWMYSQIKPHIKGKVLEIGSGIGNISRFLIEDGYETTLSDFNPEYCSILKNRFEGFSNFDGVDKIDLAHPEFDSKYKSYIGKFDTFIALNVVEHIHDDYLAIKNASKLIRKNETGGGGRVIILVPSYNFLFSKMDENLGHYRRYTVPKLSHLMNSTGLRIIDKRYFNFAGIFGWFISSKIIRDEQVGEGNMKLFNTFVPIFRLADKVIRNKAGLSTIVIGEV